MWRNNCQKGKQSNTYQYIYIISKYRSQTSFQQLRNKAARNVVVSVIVYMEKDLWLNRRSNVSRFLNKETGIGQLCLSICVNIDIWW